MPSISVDLPTTKHGYLVKADEVFWVDQGILRSTDLRDSMDEQCLADIVASIVLGEMVDRSKDYLDRVYDRSSEDSDKVIAALEVYGSERVGDEIKFCIEQIGVVCSSGQPAKLRDIVFSKRNTNGFPTVFAVILMAFHQLFVKEKKKIADYSAIKDALDNIDKRINTSRSSTSPKERKKNVDIIRALIESGFSPGDATKDIYENHSASDVEVSIRRSEIELSGYELKQGIVSLGNSRVIDEDAVGKILASITAIANNGKARTGKLILGVTDKDADAVRVKALDGVDAKKVGRRLVVGISREAKAIGKTLEEYHGIIRDRIKHSPMSESLKSSVLSNIDYNSFFGYGVVVITIPSQNELSFYDDEVYWREGDATVKASSPKQVADLAKRF